MPDPRPVRRLARHLALLSLIVQERQPRAALAASGGVHQHPTEPATRLVQSRRAGLCHLVRLDLGTCTCPDFAAQVRHAGPHMPACKHIIAAFLVDLTHRQKT